MTSVLFTIGFTQKTAEEFFDLLQNAGVRKLIDIRENPGGQLSAFAKHPDLAFFLKRIVGAEYVHEPLLAPSPEIRDAYKATGDWDEYEGLFLELMKQRDILNVLDPEMFEGHVALLCSEAGPEKCHRRLVAELLAEHWTRLGHSVEIKHLVTEKAPKRTKRKAASNAGDRPL